MNPSDLEDQVRRAHEVFHRNHATGREDLLERLAQEEPPLRRRLSRTRPRWTVSLLAAAALIVVAVALGAALWLSPQRAYALEDMPQRLLELRSIYLTGWLYGPDQTKYPDTTFVQRPDCYWFTQHGFSQSSNDSRPRVSSGYQAVRGREFLHVSLEEKKAWAAEVSPLDTELMVQTLFQSPGFGPGSPSSLDQFRKVRSENVGDVLCGVYEYTSSSARLRVWLNPKTGLPVQIGMYELDKAGQETPVRIMDHVEVNVSAEAKGLSFAAPKDCEVTHAPKASDANPLQNAHGSAAGGGAELGMWYTFKIDDRAALLCWYYQPAADEKGEEVVHLTLNGSEACDHLPVATAEVQGKQWRWWLVFPQKSGQQMGNALVHLTAERPRVKMNLSAQPLQFSEERLRSLLLEVQTATHTTTPSGEPFTLESLRAKIGNR